MGMTRMRPTVAYRGISTPGMMTGEVLTGGIRDAGSMGGGSRGLFVGVTLRANFSSSCFMLALLLGGDRPRSERVTGAEASATSGGEGAAVVVPSGAGKTSAGEEVTLEASTASAAGIAIP